LPLKIHDRRSKIFTYFVFRMLAAKKRGKVEEKKEDIPGVI
jgi:hypothetical protein